MPQKQGGSTAGKPDTLHVHTHLTDTDVYVTTISLDDRPLLTLHPAGVDTYVATWVAALARARHDAQVLHQLTAAGLGVAEAGFVITSLRGARPPLDGASPLRLEPIVSDRTGQGLVNCRLDGGDPVGQLDEATVLHHVGVVLLGVATAPLDTGYRQYAVAEMGLPAATATAMVADLANHNPSAPQPRRGEKKPSPRRTKRRRR